MKPEIREEVLQILQMLMHNISPKQHSVKKESAAPQPKLYSATADLLTIRPDDSPGIKKLKRLASLDSTELDKFQEELKAKENGSPTLAIPSEDTFIFLYGKLENLLNDAKVKYRRVFLAQIKDVKLL